MTPEQWARLTPQQRHLHVQTFGPPPPHFAAVGLPTPSPPPEWNGHRPIPAPRKNTLASTALTIGAIGLLVFPIVLGPIAFVLGGIARGMAHQRGGRREANIAVTLGLLDIVIGVVVRAWLSTYL